MIIKLGGLIAVSEIICTFILLVIPVVGIETGSDLLDLQRVDSNLLIYFQKWGRDGVYSVPIVNNSYNAKLQIIIEITKQREHKKIPHHK